jgi:hypothetical protein
LSSPLDSSSSPKPPEDKSEVVAELSASEVEVDDAVGGPELETIGAVEEAAEIGG